MHPNRFRILNRVGPLCNPTCSQLSLSLPPRTRWRSRRRRSGSEGLGAKMADLHAPSRPTTDIFGDPIDATPLWFKTSSFLSQNFDPEAYIADLRTFVPLESLRSELQSHLSSLKTELVDHLNRDYADFVSLSTRLVDVDAAVARMRAPLAELRDKVSVLRAEIAESLQALKVGLRQREEASDAREVLEMLLDTFHVVSKVEKLIQELPSTPPNWSNTDSTSAENGYFTKVQQIENGMNLRETQSILLERISSEMNRLKFNIAHAQDLPFIKNMERRIQSASSLLDGSLRDCFVAGLEHQDANTIYNCLRAYAAIGNITGAEEIFRTVIVSPSVQKILPLTTLEVVGSTSDELEGDYHKILEFIEKDCRFLLDISSTANSGLHVFDFLANSILKEVLLAVQKGKPGALSPGKPKEFLRNYKSTLSFLSHLEGYCSSKSAVVKFRAEVVYNDFTKLWNLGVYFSLRFQEIAGAVDSALSSPTITIIQNSDNNQGNYHVLTLKQSATLLDSLRSCWRDDVLVVPYSDKFLRLCLQLLSRYSTWLSSGLNARNSRATDSSLSPGSDWAITASPEHFIFIMHDVDFLITELAGDYLENVLQLLESCSLEVRDLVRQSILHAGRSLKDIKPALMDTITEMMAERSDEDLRQLKGITATYRMTNKPPPVRHSPYVSGILRPLKMSLDGEPASYLTKEAQSELLHSAAEKITTRFYEQASELVSNARKAESSLLRLRQGAKKRAGVTSDSSESNISNTDKICMQLFLDVQEYGRNLAALDVASSEIPSYRALWQCVAPPEKEAEISF